MFLPYLAYWIGAVADQYTTTRALAAGAKEVNPIARALRDKAGTTGGTILKAFGFLLLVALEVPGWAFYIVGGVQLLVAVGNHNKWWSRVKGWL